MAKQLDHLGASLKRHYLPDVTRNSNLLAILLVGQVFATLYWLLTSSGLGQFTRFAFISSYVMSVELVFIVQLNLLSKQIRNRSYIVGGFVFCLGFISSILLVEIAAQYITGSEPFSQLDADRLIMITIVGLLVSLLLLRFFAVLNVLSIRNQAESESRLLALQARIQPHFLFNSLNSIAELTATSAPDAEKAIQSLAMLFRASLENQRKRHSLQRELSLCKEYINLETWRLQERLSITWQVSVKEQSLWLMPKLILQPLIENAIVHGVQDDGSVGVSIDIRETSNHISFMVDNVAGRSECLNSSNGIALDNIRERLFVLYDDEHTFRVKHANGIYSVIMRLPKQQEQVLKGLGI